MAPRFLMTVLPEAEATLLLRLFKLVFGSVALFARNELVLQPHHTLIVKRCIRCTVQVKDPVNLLLLIRALFRRVAAAASCDGP